MKLFELARNNSDYNFNGDVDGYVIVHESRNGLDVLFNNKIYKALVVYRDSSVEIGYCDGSAQIIDDNEYDIPDV